MKTYLKRPYEKPLAAIYYASADMLHHFPSRVNIRQRIVQPSSKEQRRLLQSTSSSSSTRFQHVHWGKYGIKPLGTSDKSLCEQLQYGQKSAKVMISFDVSINIDIIHRLIGSFSDYSCRIRCSKKISRY